MEKIIHAISIYFGAIIGFMYGDTSGLLIALIAMMVVDYITGIIKGIVKQKLSSKHGFKGICKKVIILLLVSVAHLIDVYVLGGEKAVIMTITACFYIGNEGLSILENAIEIDLPVPKKLKKALKQIADDADKDDDEKDEKEDVDNGKEN